MRRQMRHHFTVALVLCMPLAMVGIRLVVEYNHIVVRKLLSVGVVGRLALV
jgi:hypothetical protein